jgi:hypothetical protein
MNNFSEEDVNILIDQTNISREVAKKLLIKYNGDIVDIILKFQTSDFDIENIDSINNEESKELKYNEDEEITDDFEVSLGDQKEHKKYREIIDSKDLIYDKIKKEKDKKKQKEKGKEEKRRDRERRQNLGLEVSDSEEEEEKFSAEDIYYMSKKHNFNSFRIL